MMYFRKKTDPMGEYVDSAGNRFSIAAARRIRTASGINVGYIPFDTLEEALAFWSIIVIETEELL